MSRRVLVLRASDGRDRAAASGVVGALAARRALLVLATLLAWAGCGKPTALEFEVEAPTAALLNPFSLSVSDYELKTEDGSIIAAVSAGATSGGRLPLGMLAPSLAGTLRLDVLSGLELVGLAFIDGVAIASGKTVAVQAQVRKPLVVVGSATAPESSTTTLAPAQLLDPTTQTDLVAAGLTVPAAQAAAFTSDGQKLLLGTASGLTIFDTGSGTLSAPSTLRFVPSLVAVAPENKGIAFVEAGTTSSRVALYADVGALLADGANATAVDATITMGVPRAAHFSPDGTMLYVLTETSGSEPCTGTTTPTPNQIIPIAADGTVGTSIAMQSYVADFAVESDGTLLLSSSVDNQISTLAPMAGATPVKLYAATCPSALRVLGTDIYAVTNDTSTDFALMHGHTDGSAASHVSIALPDYDTSLTSKPVANMTPSLSFTADAIVAQDMAVSPDGTRAVLATRARYTRSTKQTFDILGLTCVPGLDVVEYGVYSVDLDAGSASYALRSQNVITSDADTMGDCVSCSENLGQSGTLVFTLGCSSTPGDRAAGLSASFAEGP